MGNWSANARNFEFNENANPKESPRTRRFGLFEIDLRSGELRRDGHKVKLQEQPLQVLVLLLEKPGEVITREDLRNRLWPADTFVDFDHSLNAAIRRLRDALGDTAENPRFVETVARRGYRFLSPVHEGPTNGPASAVVPAAPQLAQTLTHGRRFPAWLWWIAAGASAVVLLSLGIKIGMRMNPPQVPELRSSALTANPADDRVRAAAVSWDGKFLAFSDETGVYLRQIDTGETHSITPRPGGSVESLSWVPDGMRVVAAVSNQGHDSSLWMLSALGGTPRKLCDHGSVPAVSPDGTQVAFITRHEERQEVWLMGADGGNPRKLVGERGDLFGQLAWSHDGRRLAYTRGRFAYAHGVIGNIEIVEVSRTKNSDSVFNLGNSIPLSGLDGPLAWVGDGHLIYTMGEARPRQLDSNLWSVPLDDRGRPVDRGRRLTNESGAVFSISTSGDGKRVIYVKGLPQPDVYVANIEGETIDEPRRLTLDDRQDMPYDWTADGNSVIFISDRTGTFSAYRQDLDQTVPELLVTSKDVIEAPRLSPDGASLLYALYSNAREDNASVPLMRVPLDGGTPQEVLRARFLSNHQCARMPATTCLYSAVEEGKITFFKFDPLRGDPSQVFEIKDVPPQLYNWSLSPDGNTLAIAKGKWDQEEPRIHLIPLNGGPDRWIEIDGWPGIASLDWAADSRSLWSATMGDGNALLNIDLRGRAKVVWRPQKKSVNWAIPSRDGKKLALHVGSSSANVLMLERP